MIAYIKYTDSKLYTITQINTLEDLIELMKREGRDLILLEECFDPESKGCDIFIEVYNDYRE